MTEKELPDWVGFGREVRRLRQQAGKSLDTLSRQVNLSIGMLSKIERATRAPKRDTVGKLDQALCTNGALLRRWADTTKAVADPAWYRRVEDAEKAAVEIRLYHPSLIPGPLQLREYAETVLLNGRPLDPPETITALLALKAARAERLLAPGPPVVSAVIPELVVRQCIGTPETATQQRRHLLALAESGALSLQIIPTGPPADIGLSVGAFDLLSFMDRLPLVHAEHACGGELIDDPQEAQRIVSVHGRMQAWALSPADSIDFIKSAGV
ncbi:helix-turn-helix domain-containing protein [Nocardiopsis trehalosi]|uniref:helix-turn-helix domain-containing protein n=1 Tax=Nocardiopsis trehalosi TaxID=109329 RepID=UPI0008327B4A|nr:helix-turn-helix transcriptional regulator [Nocardiopsis trehalosi]